MFEIGATAMRAVLITDEAIRRFVALSGDRNPVHSDDAYASTTQFGARIAPGIMIASYISAVIANDLPGPGAIYLGQNLRFEAPVYLGDEVTVNVRVTGIPRPGRLELETRCTNQLGKCVISGTAIVKIGTPT